MNKNHRDYYLNQIGITVWEKQVSVSSINPSFALQSSLSVNISFDNPQFLTDELWQQLKSKAEACQACTLSKTRTQVVFGVGNQQANWMIIGEAPGFYEDKQGEPFVGDAGQLLNQMISSVGKERNDIYIANVLKCHPSDNRAPLPEELQQCQPFLMQQIELLSPKIILAVGCQAAKFLLKTEQSIDSLRGKLHYWGEKKIPVIVSYHPDYLLRNPSDKSKAFTDWLSIKKELLSIQQNFTIPRCS